MKFPVHCRKENYITKKDKMIFAAVVAIAFCLTWPLAPHAAERILLTEIYVTVILVAFVSMWGDFFISEKIGYLILDQNIRFFTVVGRRRKKTYAYSDVKAIFVDECPDEYIMGRNLFRRGYSQLEWTAFYGKYIIAVDKNNIVLFVCSYRKIIWDTLLLRCKDSLEYAMNEEEYAAFKIERKKLADQVEKETVARGLEQYYRMNETEK